MNILKKRFLDLEFIDSYQRINSNHILDLYIGIDEYSNYILLMIAEDEPPKVTSSKLITLKIGLRKDKKWGIAFCLNDKNFLDLFCQFCNDIVESSQFLQNKMSGGNYICQRYRQWQIMLSNQDIEILSRNKIKGLIGELYFLKNYLFLTRGVEESIGSWIGPMFADQDFVLNDYWYEIKTLAGSSTSVSISSIQQLDVDKVGELVLVYCDETSETDDDRITINKIYYEILNQILEDSIKLKFTSKLTNMGFMPHTSYDDINYKVLRVEHYLVEESFPKIVRGNIPKEVVKANYEISIVSISQFLRGKYCGIN